MRVLVVDDDCALREALRRALELAGHEVEVAPDGETALERLAAAPEPDVVLLDIALPGIDGLMVAERVRASGSEVPILALTASGRADIRYEALAAGANAFLAKPYSLEELLERVQRLATTHERDPLPPRPPVSQPIDANERERPSTETQPSPASRRPWRTRVLVLIAAGIAAAGAGLVADLVTRGGHQPAGLRLPAMLAPAPRQTHALTASARGTVFVGTHRGLYRADARDGSLTLLGNRSFDPESLAILGRDRLLASVHPAAAAASSRGLVESRDGGRTWTAVGSAGRGDFHALRARGRLIAAYDAARGRLVISRDGGRHWQRQPFAGPLVDLTVAPTSRELLATGQAQLLRSRDWGRSWGARSETTGLLAWPSPARLYLLASDGRLWLSPNYGRRWRALGAVGDRPVAFAAAAGRLYAALRTGVIKESVNGGRSWRLFTRLR